MKLIKYYLIKYRPWIAAILMTATGLTLGYFSGGYPSSYDLVQKVAVAEPETVKESEEETAALPETVATASEAETEPVFTSSIDTLNLAFLYPEAEDDSVQSVSYAEALLEYLTKKDSNWLASIYDIANMKPEALAQKTGRAAESLRGGYNPKDELQKADTPDTWIIHKWSKIDMRFYDEKGKEITASSNAKAIMSMANTYFYYNDSYTTDALQSFAEKLWDKSHTFSYSIGDVYYCGGCLTEDDYKKESETEETASSEGSVPSSQAEAQSGQASSVEIVQTEVVTPAEPVSEQPASAAETTANVGTMETATSSQISQATTAEKEIGPGIALLESSAETDTAVSDSSAVSENLHPFCPGHVDLKIKASISSLSALYSIDPGKASNSKTASDNAAVNSFPGWNEETIQATKSLWDQEWKSVYGLDTSFTYITDILSSAEISYYMSLLPSDTSEDRRGLIQYALSSVGKVPYYWGGKPASAGYEGNRFGALVTPDDRGRIMDGLDCSGWISWVYWSAAGKRLPYESTDGLVACGKPISRSELKPGDIIVRVGEDSHVVMFLCWETDGVMKVIHEIGNSTNNVTVSSVSANWPYYRKLID